MSSEQKHGVSHDWLINTIHAKYNERQLDKLVSISTERFGGDGNNFTSEMERIKIVFSDEEENKRRTVHLVAKISKSVDNFSEAEGDLWNNKTEVEVYLNVLGQMEALMREFDDQRETLWPDFFGYIPHSVLLLEDLAQRYVLRCRSNWLDEDYALVGLRALGRFHAMSKILIKQGLIGEQYRDKHLFGPKSPYHENYLTGTLQLLSRAMIDKLGSWKDVESSDSLGKRVEAFSRTAYEKRVELYLNYDRRFEVLNHGDFRCMNMMFKTIEYTDRPCGVKFFDFQLPHINSFAYDILYFICLSVDPSVRRARRQQLLEAYQQSLADNLNFFNFDGYVPTIDDVTNEIDRLALVEFSYLTTFTCVVTSSENNPFFPEKIVTHPIDEAMNKMIFTKKRFVDGITDDFERAIQFKVI